MYAARPVAATRRRGCQNHRMPATRRSLLRTMDNVYGDLSRRLEGLGDDEYLWEPGPDMWSVRERDGAWAVDFVKPDPDPAPLTTIAWRMWHIAVDALDSYSGRAFGSTGSQYSGQDWVGNAAEATAELERAWELFRGHIEAADLTEELGPAWGAFADSTYLDLALHANHETAHHGAEVALLRDLYRTTGTD